MTVGIYTYQSVSITYKYVKEIINRDILRPSGYIRKSSNRYIDKLKLKRLLKDK